MESAVFLTAVPTISPVPMARSRDPPPAAHGRLSGLLAFMVPCGGGATPFSCELNLLVLPVIGQVPAVPAVFPQRKVVNSVVFMVPDMGSRCITYTGTDVGGPAAANTLVSQSVPLHSVCAMGTV